jgi:hypothetical protein
VGGDPHSIYPDQAAMSFDHGQTGDVSTHDVAGRDVHRVGVSESAIQAILDRQTTFQSEIITLFSKLISQVNDDAKDRQVRQEQIDNRQRRLDLRLTRIEFWLLALTLLWIVGAVFLVWLLVDRYVAEAAARLATGAMAALMIWRALH